MRVVDAHLHLWNPDILTYRWLEGDLDAPFAEAELREDPIEDVETQVAVFVQADPIDKHAIDEVRWVESIARATGVVGIVAGARLDRGRKLEKHLDALAEFELVVGVRHLLQDEKDGFARSRAFIDGARELAARGLTFDACVRHHQIPDVIALAEAVPGLRIVLDHLGKPAIGTVESPLPPSAEWIDALRELAAHPQALVKLSGLPAESGGRIDEGQMEPYLDVAAEAFGEDRLMWGSDWPVSSVDVTGQDSAYYFPGNRDDWCHTVADWAQDRGLDAEKLFWSNAVGFYGIR
ncbi:MULTISPECIES: amidohydrolase family protein [unclassified Microbacterium]|uniref:amidohydrolase family protein n=1 Tax=unclassified Microbacterium TaxID=2609290 RepID=UPI002CF63184|nr:amidohydrolase family protein [Microbacterium sp.]HWK78610.1 amidohydrolase family protein [Microbacterium sp.]